MNIDLRKLNHVVVIARLRSYSRAAEQLHITQSALTRSVQSLEARYGIRLFDRSRAGVNVTTAGRELVAMAENLLSSSRDIEQYLQLAGNRVGGSLTFGMAPGPARYILPRLMPQLIESGCGRINAAVQRRGTLMQSLLARDLEFVIAPATSGSDNVAVSTEVIAHVPSGLFVRPGHPLATAATIDDLAGFPLASTGILDMTSRIFGEMVQPGQQLIVTDSLSVLIDLVKETDTIGLTGFWALADDLRARILVPLSLSQGGGAHDAALALHLLRHHQPSRLALNAIEKIKAICATTVMPV